MIVLAAGLELGVQTYHKVAGNTVRLPGQLKRRVNGRNEQID